MVQKIERCLKVKSAILLQTLPYINFLVKIRIIKEVVRELEFLREMNLITEEAYEKFRNSYTDLLNTYLEKILELLRKTDSK